MDPNAALADARAAHAALLEQFGPDNVVYTQDYVESLMAAFDALDGWLSRGGALPKGWAR